MGKATRVTMLLIVLGLCCLSFSQTAHGYIDPGTGSFIFQLVLASLLGALFLIRIKIKSLFNRLFSRGKKGEEGEE